jgi:hypothetical protein
LMNSPSRLRRTTITTTTTDKTHRTTFVGPKSSTAFTLVSDTSN